MATGSRREQSPHPVTDPQLTCGFVPGYLLRRLARPEAGDRLGIGPPHPVHPTLRLDEQFRERRESAARTLVAPAAAGAPGRVVHSAHNTEQLPGEVVRSEGDGASGDVAVDEAYDAAGEVLALFAQEFGRDSVDGRGAGLSITVHYGQAYDNAFWDGTQLVFGDGDGEVFERFTKPMDVMAHEFTHGVTQYTAGLAYRGQSGALNESVSDVFASMTKQRHLGQTAEQADWLIGEGLFTAAVNGRALRSMIQPGTAYDDPRIGKDPQVSSMADYVDTAEDNGGVHLNSGIPNRAFALAALALGGHSWERAGRVWYAALTGGEVQAGTDFAGFAAATLSAARREFPGDAAVNEQIAAAWREVGVLDASPPAPARQQGGPQRGGPQPADPQPGGARPESPEPQTVVVRRSGGFAGMVRSAELDLDDDPDGPLLRQLLSRVAVRGLEPDRPAPDRFVYTLHYGSWQITVPEQALTPELDQVVRTVLDRGREPRWDFPAGPRL